jgi:hypothetical protein
LAIAALRPGWASEIAQLHPDQAALDQAARELPPEGLGLRLADIEPDHLAAARVVHALCDHQALAPHPAAVADLLDLGASHRYG